MCGLRRRQQRFIRFSNPNYTQDCTMLHQLIEWAGLGTHLDTPVERAGAFAVGLLILDSFIAYGPLRVFLLRAFNQRNLRKQEARRFLSQLAAKLVGMVFLAAVFPPTFEALASSELTAGHRFLAATPVSQRVCEIGAGYFIYDIIICLFKYGDNGAEFLLHAVVCCTVFCTAAFKGIMHYYGAAFLLWELSTPFMYMRWLLLKAGWGQTVLLKGVNMAFVAVFFGCRNVWGPIATLDFWRQSAAELAAPSTTLPAAALWTIRCMAVSLNCLNAYWFSQMVSVAIKGGQPKQKGV